MDQNDGNDSGAEIPMIAELTSTIAELTICLSQAYTVRDRIRMEHGKTELALANLDDALRLDPGNADANRLGGLIERHPG